MFLRSAFLLLGLAIPFTCSAAQMTLWDFRYGNVPGTWNVNGWGAQPEKTAEGLFIRATEEGRMIREAGLSHRVDTLRIVLRRSQQSEAFFLWNDASMPRTSVVQLPLLIKGGQDREVIEMDISKYPQWNGHPAYAGIGLPAGSEQILESIELTGYSPLEKLLWSLRSFWHFDTFRSYTINFLWGPVLNFNPIAIKQTFDTLPPPGWSGNRIFYAVLLLTALGVGAHRFLRGPSRSSLFVFVGVFAALWLLFDLRMGFEILRYAKHDYDTFVSQEKSGREFRNYQNFYEVAERALPYLQQNPRYVFLAPSGTPFLGIMNYLSYPSSTHQVNDLVPKGSKWLVFRRPDISLNEQNQIAVDSRVVSPSGKVLLRFDDSSFLFESQ